MCMLCCLKWPSFNPYSTMRVKLVCIKHRNIEKALKFMDICPCIYGADEETIEKLKSESITREEIIEIEVKKWLELVDDTKNYYAGKFGSKNLPA